MKNRGCNYLTDRGSRVEGTQSQQSQICLKYEAQCKMCVTKPFLWAGDGQRRAVTQSQRGPIGHWEEREAAMPPAGLQQRTTRALQVEELSPPGGRAGRGDGDAEEHHEGGGRAPGVHR